MSGRVPLPPQQPPKSARSSFRPHNRQQKRKRPTDDDDAVGPSRGGATGDRRPPRPKKQKQQKQQKQQKPATETSTEGGADGDAAATPKPKQKKAKKSKNAVDEADLDYDLGLNRAVARMDAEAAAAYLTRQTKRYGSDLSEVELADLSIAAAAVQDTSSYDKDRTLDNLADFLQATVDGGKGALQTAPKANGAPHTIIVTGAGLRAADLARAVRSFQTKTSTVSKLFAKHIKLAEAVASLQSRRTGIAVGTPARLIDLLDNGALSVEHLQRIIVDASHIDQKKRGVLDMQDTALPVARWLARPEFKARYGGASEEAAKDMDASKPLSIIFY